MNKKAYLSNLSIHCFILFLGKRLPLGPLFYVFLVCVFCVFFLGGGEEEEYNIPLCVVMGFFLIKKIKHFSPSLGV